MALDKIRFIFISNSLRVDLLCDTEEGVCLCSHHPFSFIVLKHIQAREINPGPANSEPKPIRVEEQTPLV